MAKRTGRKDTTEASNITNNYYQLSLKNVDFKLSKNITDTKIAVNDNFKDFYNHYNANSDNELDENELVNVLMTLRNLMAIMMAR